MKAIVHCRISRPLLAAIVTCMCGCQGSVSLIPSADPALRKPPAMFSSDAAKRQYEADAPKIPASDFRADYALVLRQVNLANISTRDCSNVEVWLNGKFVVYCPTFPGKSDKTLTFRMFYDRDGHVFDTNGGRNPIQSIDVYHDGTMYAVINHVADMQ